LVVNRGVGSNSPQDGLMVSGLRLARTSDRPEMKGPAPVRGPVSLCSVVTFADARALPFPNLRFEPANALSTKPDLFWEFTLGNRFVDRRLRQASKVTYLAYAKKPFRSHFPNSIVETHCRSTQFGISRGAGEFSREQRFARQLFRSLDKKYDVEGTARS